MGDLNIYRNELLKKYIRLALIISLLLSPIYYYVGNYYLAGTLNLFFLLTYYLNLSSKNLDRFVINSRIFMVAIFFLFFMGFIHSNQIINSTYFLLLFPIASFSIRGVREGIYWSVPMALVFIFSYMIYPELYNIYSFIFFLVAYFMVSYLLFYYRVYEFKNFKKINRNLESLVDQRTVELKSLNKTLENQALTLEEKNKELEHLAVTDQLTKLFNRKKLDETMESELHRTMRYNHLFSVILLDVDHFKSVNDTYGHQVGDQLLVDMSKLLKENLRDTDIIGRWGGEEFMIICPETDLIAAIKLAENLRLKIETHKFDVIDSKTSSFGVTVYKKDDDHKSIVARADEALYTAKTNGRNRVEFL